MRRLQVAFVEERIVRAQYIREGGAASERRLEPHALIINWPAWYVLAHDLVRGESRTFRLDRFERVDIEPDTFRPRPQQFYRELVETTGVVPARV